MSVPSAPRWLYVGRVAAPFGVAGDVRLVVDTEFPEQLASRPVYLGPEHRPASVERLRLHRRDALVKFSGIDSVDAADALRGKELFIAIEDAVPLPEGRYYVHQIVGLEVWTVEGEHYGVVRDVLLRPANDVYVVRHAGKDVLVPAIRDVVKGIDLGAGRLIIEVMPGLE